MCVEEGKADDPWRVPGEKYLLSLLMMTCSATTAECLLLYSIFSYCGDRDTKYDSCQSKKRKHCIIPFPFAASPLQCSHAPTTKSRVDTRHLAFFFPATIIETQICPTLPLLGHRQEGHVDFSGGSSSSIVCVPLPETNDLLLIKVIKAKERASERLTLVMNTLRNKIYGETDSLFKKWPVCLQATGRATTGI